MDVLRGEIVTVMGDWGKEILARPEAWANQFYQGFIALNYCRAWCDLDTGTVGSKRRGAEWAKAAPATRVGGFDRPFVGDADRPGENVADPGRPG